MKIDLRKGLPNFLENVYLLYKSKEFETRSLPRVKISLAETYHNLLKPKHCKFFTLEYKISLKGETR